MQRCEVMKISEVFIVAGSFLLADAFKFHQEHHPIHFNLWSLWTKHCLSVSNGQIPLPTWQRLRKCMVRRPCPVNFVYHVFTGVTNPQPPSGHRRAETAHSHRPVLPPRGTVSLRYECLKPHMPPLYRISQKIEPRGREKPEIQSSIKFPWDGRNTHSFVPMVPPIH